MGRNFAWLAALIAAIVLACSVPITGRVADPRDAQWQSADTADPGCAAATLVSTGGSLSEGSEDSGHQMDRLFEFRARFQSLRV